MNYTSADKYRREQDLIFQALEESEQLQRQAAMKPRKEFIEELRKQRDHPETA